MPPAAAIAGSDRSASFELARHELTLDLEPDDEEEDRDEGVVHPVAEVS